jgi:hypothetical protein
LVDWAGGSIRTPELSSHFIAHQGKRWSTPL